jgi:hypothetical protein
MTAFKSAFTSVKYHAITAPAIRQARRAIKGAAKHFKEKLRNNPKTRHLVPAEAATKVTKGGKKQQGVTPQGLTLPTKGSLLNSGLKKYERKPTERNTTIAAIKRSKTYGELGRRIRVQALKATAHDLKSQGGRSGTAESLQQLRKAHIASQQGNNNDISGPASQLFRKNHKAEVARRMKIAAKKIMTKKK